MSLDAFDLPPNWRAAFRRTLESCALRAGDTVCVLHESTSRPQLVALARAAALDCGATVFELRVPTPDGAAPLPIRSTGASLALRGQDAALAALAASTLVLDCTVEGLMHAPELPRILAGGARVLYVSNEHPEVLARLLPDAAVETAVKSHVRRLRAAQTMHVRSSAGTDLRIRLAGCPVGGNWGYTAKPGTLAHWPGGLVLAFPRQGSVDGRLVLAPGDVNLTHKRYVERAVALTIRADTVVDIEGEGIDAALLRTTFDAWQRCEGHDACRAVSHVGYGLNPAARWDALAYYDRGDFNGTELRAVAGSFLYSTGANETAGRHTLGHFDWPLFGCDIDVDEVAVVRAGRLLEA
jgi:2,5-dihydroxypyridine 5,6-dioxygenase